MVVFCRLRQEEISLDQREPIQSGQYLNSNIGDADTVLFNIGRHINEHVKFVDINDKLTQKERDILSQRQAIVFDSIYDIEKKFAHDDIETFSHFLPPEIGKDQQPTDLIKAIEEAFNSGVLHTINQMPRMSMKYDVDILPTSRVKRYANSYQTHLVAHSECWQQRTLVGIVPKKLLAKVSEDELAIYENIVFVRLIDNLVHYLSGLSTKLQQVLDFLENFGDFEAIEKDYRYRQSISNDWGRAFSQIESDDELKRQSTSLLESVAHYLRQLIQLKSGNLYRHIPKSYQVPLQLKQSNILMHDKNYRRMAKLWRKWLQSSSVERLSASQIQRKRKREFLAYSDYIKKILMQMLRIEGWGIGSSHTNFKHNSGVTVTIQERTLAVWDILFEGEVVCRIVANSEPVFTMREEKITNVPLILVTPKFYAEKVEPLTIELSPLSIEGKEVLTGVVYSHIWRKAAELYTKPITTRMPAKVMAILSDNVGYYIDRHDLAKIKSESHQDLYNVIKKQRCLAEFVRCCPCCATKADANHLTHNELGYLKARCRNNECGIEWVMDSTTRRTISVNKNKLNSGRFAFMISMDFDNDPNARKQKIVN